MATVAQTLPTRVAPTLPRQAVMVVLAALPLALVLVFALRLIGAWSMQSNVENAPAPAFVSYALGSLPQAAPLLSAPDPDAAMAAGLPAGSRVRVGGRVAGRGPGAGLLWVSATVEGVTVFGFVRPAAVRMEAGEAPPLDLRGVPIAALLSPDAGVRMLPLAESPGGPGAGPVSGTSAGMASDGVAVSSTTTGQSLDAASMAASGSNPAAPATIGIGWLPGTLTPWIGLLEAAGARHGVDPELLAIIALVESGGDPGARSGAGAMGLMQVMPGTAGDIARWRGIPSFQTAALHEPAVSIDFGAWYLARQLATFGLAEDPDWATSVERAAAAYNGGPGSVSAWLAGRALPAEAERYRIYVGGMWAERHDASSPAYERWLRAGGQRLVTAAAARQADMVAATGRPVGGAGAVLSTGARTAALAAGAVAVTP